MKTRILSIILLGVASLMYSQNQLASNTVNVNSLTSVKSSIANAKFVKALSTNAIPLRAKKLQNYVAQYQISEADVYNVNLETSYTVVFKEANNAITNVYDKNGVILKSEQEFQGIRLPYELLASIAKEHPGWGVKNVNCNVNYIKGEVPNITYEVKIKKESATKNLKLSV